MLEHTLVLIKPEAIQKNLTGIILDKILSKGISIVGMKTVKVSDELARKHYSHLKDKPFFDEVIEYFKGDFYSVKGIVAIVFEGENIIKNVRSICGATNPEEAEPTTIRGAFGRITTKGVFENIIHASSSIEDAKREIQLWFSPSELLVNIFNTKKTVSQKEEVVWEEE